MNKRCNSLMLKIFTLIELMITISIIAVLAAMLLPALNKARENSKRIFCLSNVKHVGLGFLSYCDDNKGFLPRGLIPKAEFGGAANGIWTTLLAQDNRYLTAKVLRCPVMPYPASYPPSTWNRLFASQPLGSWMAGCPSYGYSYKYIGGGESGDKPTVKLSSLPASSKTILAADTISSNRASGAALLYYRYTSGYSIAWPIHQGNVNVLWCDGHASSVNSGVSSSIGLAAMRVYSAGYPLDSSFTVGILSPWTGEIYK